MAITEAQVAKLYVLALGRPADASGAKYWLEMANTNNWTEQQLIGAAIESDAAKKEWGDAANSNEGFVNYVYNNILGRQPDEEGKKYWLEILEKNGGDKAQTILHMYNSAIADPKGDQGAKDKAVFEAKVKLAGETAKKGVEFENKDFQKLNDIFKSIKADEKVNNIEEKSKAFDEALANVGKTENPSDTNPVMPDGSKADVVLTAETDKVEGNIIYAPMVNDKVINARVKSLQDEDVITGSKKDGSNAIYIEMGTGAGEQSDPEKITPTLKNIQKVNVDFTGKAKELDLSNSDSVKEININKVTAEAANGNIEVTNINQKVDNASISNVARNQTSNIELNFNKNALKADNDTLNLNLSNIATGSIKQTSNDSTEGYETVNLNVKNNVNVKTLQLNQLKELNIKGDGNLEIVSLKEDSRVPEQFERLNQGRDGGIESKGGLGLNKIDASEFKGTLKLDISKVINPAANPANSGQDAKMEIIGSKGDDVLYTNTAPGKFTHIDLKDGNDTLNVIDASIKLEEDQEVGQLKGIEKLALKLQTNKAQSADLKAFDEALSEVEVRNENPDIDPNSSFGGANVAKFELKNVSDALAKSGKITLKHSVDTKINKNETINNTSNKVDGTDVKFTAIKTTDPKATPKERIFDEFTLNVVNDKNTQKVFNYEVDVLTKKLTINDGTDTAAETESNILTLSKNPLEALVLNGGTKDTDYEVNGAIYYKENGVTKKSHLVDSKLIDASNQKSNLEMAVGRVDKDGKAVAIDQTIKLGSGNDFIEFANIDDLGSKDEITDAGGDDTVRALFSKDSTLNLTGIENLQTAATKNINLSLGKSDIENLVLLSDKAAQADKLNMGDGKINKAAEITFKDAEIAKVDFRGNLYEDNEFNGVNVEKAKDGKVAVNVGAEVFGDTPKPDTNKTNYKVGKITLGDNAKTLDVNVANLTHMPKSATKSSDIKIGKATIDNIYAKGLENLNVKANGDVDLGLVTASNTFNSIKSVDATGVKGYFTARVKALGDNAEVKLGNKNSEFDATGSAGKNIKITSGNGNDTITGTAQDDEINAGNGNNTINAGRGDNVIVTGSGNDEVTTLEGNDTVSLGSGNDKYTDINVKDGSAVSATTSISKTGGTLQYEIQGKESVKQFIAVKEGNNLQLNYKDGKLLETSTLNGNNLKTDASKELATDGDDFIVYGVEKVDEATHEITFKKNDALIAAEKNLAEAKQAAKEAKDTYEAAKKAVDPDNEWVANASASGNSIYDVEKQAESIIDTNSNKSMINDDSPNSTIGTATGGIQKTETLVGTGGLKDKINAAVTELKKKYADEQNFIDNQVNALKKIVERLDALKNASVIDDTTKISEKLDNNTVKGVLDDYKVALENAITAAKAISKKNADAIAQAIKEDNFEKADELLQKAIDKYDGANGTNQGAKEDSIVGSDKPLTKFETELKQKGITDLAQDKQAAENAQNQINPLEAQVNQAKANPTDTVSKSLDGGDGDDVLMSPYDGIKFASTLKGGAGNDTIIGSDFADNSYEGGLGKDIISLTATGAKATQKSKVIIKDGDSVLGSHDVIYGFNSKANGSSISQLDLDEKTVNRLVDTNFEGVESGSIKYAKMGENANVGEVKFFKDENKSQTLIINKDNLADAVNYIAAAMKKADGKQTAYFAYDANNDGKIDKDDSVMIYQEGEKGTLVELAGTQTSDIAGHTDDIC